MKSLLKYNSFIEESSKSDKNYNIYMNESIEHKWGCVMIEVNVSNWDEIVAMIDPDDVYTNDEDEEPRGIESNPHITLLYGFSPSVKPKQVKSIFCDFEGDLKIEIDGIGIFETPNFDVVKFNIKPDGSLQYLHDRLSELPNHDKFKDYRPHITIAYVKKGTGKKYINNDYHYTIKNVNKVTYSTPDGHKVNFDCSVGSIIEESNIIINENKMWYKTIPEILDYLNNRSKIPFIFIDSETTGLGGPKLQQLTQLSAIVSDWDYNYNTFKDIDEFDEKIKLTSETKSKFKNKEDKTKWVLGFNHYGDGNYKYKEEEVVISNFIKWLDDYTPSLLVLQNASFDMSMIGGRSNYKIKNEVFDTKTLIQLYYLPLLQKLAETNNEYENIINKIGKSDRDFGLISSSMSKVGPVLGVNMSGYHDALTDVKITMDMFSKIIDFLKENQEVDIMKYQLQRINKIKENS